MFLKNPSEDVRDDLKTRLKSSQELLGQGPYSKHFIFFVTNNGPDKLDHYIK